MTSGFRFTGTAYGITLHGVGFAFGWQYAPGEAAKLAHLDRRQVKRAALRMRRAWERAS